ncbi:hypothetical protein [Dyella sp. 2RAB6]|uniref:hypothetical protein n=1 Tax=Dyella sp. 2RAB6 TaxID=3232992 RepID=UPI003F8F20F7
MFQQHIREDAGRFWPCAECHHEPRHIECRGRSRRETMQFKVHAVRHSLECACGRSTGMHATLEAAEAEWGKRYSQFELALVAPAPSRVTRMPRTARKAEAAGR